MFMCPESGFDQLEPDMLTHGWNLEAIRPEINQTVRSGNALIDWGKAAVQDVPRSRSVPDSDSGQLNLMPKQALDLSKLDVAQVLVPCSHPSCVWMV